jgi:hypothetical protein
MQKGSDCEIFADLVYFVLKFPKRVNCGHFYQFWRHDGQETGNAAVGKENVSLSILSQDSVVNGVCIISANTPARLAAPDVRPSRRTSQSQPTGGP